MKTFFPSFCGALLAAAATLAGAAPFAYFTQASGNLLILDSATNAVAATIPVGINPFTAVVNPAGTRVYVSNFGSDSISVLNTFTDAVIATIPVAAGPQGIAVDPTGARVYVASSAANMVSVIDAATDSVLTTIPVVGSTDAIVNPAGTRLYVTGGPVFVIDTSTNAVLTTITPPANAALIGMAMTPDGSRLYVRDIGNRTVLVIDATTNSLLTTIPLATAFTFGGLVVSPDGTKLYASNGVDVAVIDTASNLVTGTISMGTTSGVINGVGLTPDGTRGYAATRSGIVSFNTTTQTAATVLPGDVRAFDHFIGPTSIPNVFTVINNNDSGVGSLRGAVALANAAVPPSVITFAPNVTGTILLTAGSITIGAGPLTILGPGAGTLAIDGGASDRIFTIYETGGPACPALTAPSDYLVSISGLTLQNGLRNSDNSGGAILSAHSLALDSVVIKGNVAPRGGGVSLSAQYAGQTLTISNSQFLDNVVRPTAAGTVHSDYGGGLLIAENCGGTQTVTSTTIGSSVFSRNRSQPTTLSGYGAGIASYTPGTVTITDSRIVDNHIDVPNPPVAGQVYRGAGIYASITSTFKLERTEVADNSVIDGTVSDQARGGGIVVWNGDPNRQTAGTASGVQIVNSTISGNSVPATAGAVWIFGNVAVEIDNSTITNNGAGVNRTGGILMTTGATFPVTAGNALPPTLTLASSILAANAVTTADLSSNVATIPAFTVNASNSMIQTICPTCNITVVGTGNILATAPLTGPLAFNGGPTRTHALLAGSPALDTGSNPLTLTTDQRGPGFARVVGGSTDMGAYEANGASPPHLASVKSRKVHGTAGTFDLALSLLSTAPSTESRTGPAQTIVMTFDKPIASADNPTIAEGAATFGSMSIAGNDVIMNFTGVTNLQYVTFSLANVAASDGGIGGTGAVRVGYLFGDVNQSRQVTVADVGIVNSVLLQSVSNANFLRDVNVDGKLTVADKGLTNANLLQKLPTP